jgi:hypothetical protein
MKRITIDIGPLFVLPKHLITSLVLIASCALAACGDDGESEPGVTDSGSPPVVCSNPATDCFSPELCQIFECIEARCVSVNLSADTPCGEVADSSCDKPDSCDGNGACVKNFVDTGTACGSDVTSECDAADSCDGIGACQPNNVTMGTACGNPATGLCNEPDSCDGSGVCGAN